MSASGSSAASPLRGSSRSSSTGRPSPRAGFDAVEAEDLSVEWAEILRSRLELYRSLPDDEEWNRNYAFFVGLVESGRLGGARFAAA